MSTNLDQTEIEFFNDDYNNIFISNKDRESNKYIKEKMEKDIRQICSSKGHAKLVDSNGKISGYLIINAKNELEKLVA